MKKTLAIVLTLMLAATLCVGLIACNSGVEGTYKFKSMKMDLGAIKMDIEAGKEVDLMGTKMTVEADAYVLTINADNTLKFEVNFMGETASIEGTWEQKDGKILLTMEGETTEATLSGNTLSFTQDGMELKLAK